METKRDLEDKAKALIPTNPDQAVQKYSELWKSFPDEFNGWDALNAISSMKASNSPDVTWATGFIKKFKDEKITNLYGWLVFDKFVKGKNHTEILANEQIIAGMITLVPQKSSREDGAIPCPMTISIFKLCDAHGENLFNARRINELLLGLDYSLLSDKARTIGTKERGDVELSSDLEKYFALKTKSLLKLKDYASCIDYCTIGLDLFEKFHFNNDLWFKMRIALSEEGLGNHEKSQFMFKELLESKAGSDKWFLYRDISELYFEQGDFLKAWKYAVDGAFYGNEPHFLIGLYLLQARILIKLERGDEGKILAELIAAILVEHGWKGKEEYNKLFHYYKIDFALIRKVNDVLKVANVFWQKERYGNKQQIKGKIISIHQNGKTGRIKDQNNNIIGFHKKDLVKKAKLSENLIGAPVSFYAMKSYDDKLIAEVITITEVPNPSKSHDLVGKTLNGTVKNVSDFGIFIQIPDSGDGLLHKNSLPNNLKTSFKDVFFKDQRVKVKIEKVSEKGIQLGLVEYD